MSTDDLEKPLINRHERLVDYFVVLGPQIEDGALLREDVMERADSFSILPVSNLFLASEKTRPPVEDDYGELHTLAGQTGLNFNPGLFKSATTLMVSRKSKPGQYPITNIIIVPERNEKRVMLPDDAIKINKKPFTPADINIYVSRDTSQHQQPIMDIVAIDPARGEMCPQDYVQLDTPIHKWFICIKRRQTAIAEGDAHGQVVQSCLKHRVPKLDHPDHDLDYRGLSALCFPSGIILSASQKAPQHMAFVITRPDGSEIYATTLTIFDQIPLNLLKDDPNYQEYCRLATQPNGKTGGSIFFPTCLCILSRWPFFTAFRTVLDQIYAISQHYKIEPHLRTILLQTQLPRPGLRTVSLNLNGQAIVFNFLPKMAIPCVAPEAGLHLTSLFECLSIPNIITTWRHVLVEGRVILFSQDYKKLTPILDALRSLIFPLRWQCVFIPILPTSMAFTVRAPFPFLVGVHKSFLDDIEISSDILLVDLDRNALRLPRPQSKKEKDEELEEMEDPGDKKKSQQSKKTKTTVFIPDTPHSCPIPLQISTSPNQLPLTPTCLVNPSTMTCPALPLELYTQLEKALQEYLPLYSLILSEQSGHPAPPPKPLSSNLQPAIDARGLSSPFTTNPTYITTVGLHPAIMKTAVLHSGQYAASVSVRPGPGAELSNDHEDVHGCGGLNAAQLREMGARLSFLRIILSLIGSYRQLVKTRPKLLPVHFGSLCTPSIATLSHMMSYEHVDHYTSAYEESQALLQQTSQKLVKPVDNFIKLPNIRHNVHLMQDTTDENGDFLTPQVISPIPSWDPPVTKELRSSLSVVSPESAVLLEHNKLHKTVPSSWHPFLSKLLESQQMAEFIGTSLFPTSGRDLPDTHTHSMPLPTLCSKCGFMRVLENVAMVFSHTKYQTEVHKSPYQLSQTIGLNKKDKKQLKADHQATLLTTANTISQTHQILFFDLLYALSTLPTNTFPMPILSKLHNDVNCSGLPQFSEYNRQSYIQSHQLIHGNTTVQTNSLDSFLTEQSKFITIPHVFDSFVQTCNLPSDIYALRYTIGHGYYGQSMFTQQEPIRHRADRMTYLFSKLHVFNADGTVTLKNAQSAVTGGTNVAGRLSVAFQQTQTQQQQQRKDQQAQLVQRQQQLTIAESEDDEDDETDDIKNSVIMRTAQNYANAGRSVSQQHASVNMKSSGLTTSPSFLESQSNPTNRVNNPLLSLYQTFIKPSFPLGKALSPFGLSLATRWPMALFPVDAKNSLDLQYNVKWTHTPTALRQCSCTDFTTRPMDPTLEIAITPDSAVSVLEQLGRQASNDYSVFVIPPSDPNEREIHQGPFPEIDNMKILSTFPQISQHVAQKTASVFNHLNPAPATLYLRSLGEAVDCAIDSLTPHVLELRNTLINEMFDNVKNEQWKTSDRKFEPALYGYAVPRRDGTGQARQAIGANTGGTGRTRSIFTSQQQQYANNMLIPHTILDDTLGKMNYKNVGSDAGSSSSSAPTSPGTGGSKVPSPPQTVTGSSPEVGPLSSVSSSSMNGISSLTDLTSPHILSASTSKSLQKLSPQNDPSPATPLWEANGHLFPQSTASPTFIGAQQSVGSVYEIWMWLYLTRKRSAASMITNSTIFNEGPCMKECYHAATQHQLQQGLVPPKGHSNVQQAKLIREPEYITRMRGQVSEIEHKLGPHPHAQRAQWHLVMWTLQQPEHILKAKIERHLNASQGAWELAISATNDLYQFIHSNHDPTQYNENCNLAVTNQSTTSFRNENALLSPSMGTHGLIEQDDDYLNRILSKVPSPALPHVMSLVVSLRIASHNDLLVCMMQLHEMLVRRVLPTTGLVFQLCLFAAYSGLELAFQALYRLLGGFCFGPDYEGQTSGYEFMYDMAQASKRKRQAQNAQGLISASEDYLGNMYRYTTHIRVPSHSMKQGLPLDGLFALAIASRSHFFNNMWTNSHALTTIIRHQTAQSVTIATDHLYRILNSHNQMLRGTASCGTPAAQPITAFNFQNTSHPPQQQGLLTISESMGNLAQLLQREKASSSNLHLVPSIQKTVKQTSISYLKSQFPGMALTKDEIAPTMTSTCIPYPAMVWAQAQCQKCANTLSGAEILGGYSRPENITDGIECGVCGSYVRPKIIVVFDDHDICAYYYCSAYYNIPLPSSLLNSELPSTSPPSSPTNNGISNGTYIESKQYSSGCCSTHQGSLLPHQIRTYAQHVALQNNVTTSPTNHFEAALNNINITSSNVVQNLTQDATIDFDLYHAIRNNGNSQTTSTPTAPQGMEALYQPSPKNAKKQSSSLAMLPTPPAEPTVPLWIEVDMANPKFIKETIQTLINQAKYSPDAYVYDKQQDWWNLNSTPAHYNSFETPMNPSSFGMAAGTAGICGELPHADNNNLYTTPNHQQIQTVQQSSFPFPFAPFINSYHNTVFDPSFSSNTGFFNYDFETAGLAGGNASNGSSLSSGSTMDAGGIDDATATEIASRPCPLSVIRATPMLLWSVCYYFLTRSSHPLPHYTEILANNANGITKGCLTFSPFSNTFKNRAEYTFGLLNQSAKDATINSSFTLPANFHLPVHFLLHDGYDIYDLIKNNSSSSNVHNTNGSLSPNAPNSINNGIKESILPRYGISQHPGENWYCVREGSYTCPQHQNFIMSDRSLQQVNQQLSTIFAEHGNKQGETMTPFGRSSSHDGVTTPHTISYEDNRILAFTSPIYSANPAEMMKLAEQYNAAESRTVSGSTAAQASQYNALKYVCSGKIGQTLVMKSIDNTQNNDLEQYLRLLLEQRYSNGAKPDDKPLIDDIIIDKMTYKQYFSSSTTFANSSSHYFNCPKPVTPLSDATLVNSINPRGNNSDLVYSPHQNNPNNHRMTIYNVLRRLEPRSSYNSTSSIIAPFVYSMKRLLYSQLPSTTQVNRTFDNVENIGLKNSITYGDLLAAPRSRPASLFFDHFKSLINNNNISSSHKTIDFYEVEQSTAYTNNIEMVETLWGPYDLTLGQVNGSGPNLYSTTSLPISQLVNLSSSHLLTKPLCMEIDRGFTPDQFISAVSSNTKNPTVYSILSERLRKLQHKDVDIKDRFSRNGHVFPSFHWYYFIPPVVTLSSNDMNVAHPEVQGLQPSASTLSVYTFMSNKYENIDLTSNNISYITVEKLEELTSFPQQQHTQFFLPPPLDKQSLAYRKILTWAPSHLHEQPLYGHAMTNGYKNHLSRQQQHLLPIMPYYRSSSQYVQHSLTVFLHQQHDMSLILNTSLDIHHNNLLVIDNNNGSCNKIHSCYCTPQMFRNKCSVCTTCTTTLSSLITPTSTSVMNIYAQNNHHKLSSTASAACCSCYLAASPFSPPTIIPIKHQKHFFVPTPIFTLVNTNTQINYGNANQELLIAQQMFALQAAQQKIKKFFFNLHKEFAEKFTEQQRDAITSLIKKIVNNLMIINGDYMDPPPRRGQDPKPYPVAEATRAELYKQLSTLFTIEQLVWLKQAFFQHLDDNNLLTPVKFLPMLNNGNISINGGNNNQNAQSSTPPPPPPPQDDYSETGGNTNTMANVMANHKELLISGKLDGFAPVYLPSLHNLLTYALQQNNITAANIAYNYNEANYPTLTKHFLVSFLNFIALYQFNTCSCAYNGLFVLQQPWLVLLLCVFYKSHRVLLDESGNNNNIQSSPVNPDWVVDLSDTLVGGSRNEQLLSLKNVLSHILALFNNNHLNEHVYYEMHHDNKQQYCNISPGANGTKYNTLRSPLHTTTLGPCVIPTQLIQSLFTIYQNSSLPPPPTQGMSQQPETQYIHTTFDPLASPTVPLHQYQQSLSSSGKQQPFAPGSYNPSQGGSFRAQTMVGKASVQQTPPIGRGTGSFNSFNLGLPMAHNDNGIPPPPPLPPPPVLPSINIASINQQHVSSKPGSPFQHQATAPVDEYTLNASALDGVLFIVYNHIRSLYQEWARHVLSAPVAPELIPVMRYQHLNYLQSIQQQLSGLNTAQQLLVRGYNNVALDTKDERFDRYKELLCDEYIAVNQYQQAIIKWNQLPESCYTAHQHIDYQSIIMSSTPAPGSLQSCVSRGHQVVPPNNSVASAQAPSTNVKTTVSKDPVSNTVITTTTIRVPKPLNVNVIDNSPAPLLDECATPPPRSTLPNVFAPSPPQSVTSLQQQSPPVSPPTAELPSIPQQPIPSILQSQPSPVVNNPLQALANQAANVSAQFTFTQQLSSGVQATTTLYNQNLNHIQPSPTNAQPQQLLQKPGYPNLNVQTSTTSQSQMSTVQSPAIQPTTQPSQSPLLPRHSQSITNTLSNSLATGNFILPSVCEQQPKLDLIPPVQPDTQRQMSNLSLPAPSLALSASHPIGHNQLRNSDDSSPVNLQPSSVQQQQLQRQIPQRNQTFNPTLPAPPQSPLPLIPPQQYRQLPLIVDDTNTPQLQPQTPTHFRVPATPRSTSASISSTTSGRFKPPVTQIPQDSDTEHAPRTPGSGFRAPTTPKVGSAMSTSFIQQMHQQGVEGINFNDLVGSLLQSAGSVPSNPSNSVSNTPSLGPMNINSSVSSTPQIGPQTAAPSTPRTAPKQFNFRSPGVPATPMTNSSPLPPSVPAPIPPGPSTNAPAPPTGAAPARPPPSRAPPGAPPK